MELRFSSKLERFSKIIKFHLTLDYDLKSGKLLSLRATTWYINNICPAISSNLLKMICSKGHIKSLQKHSRLQVRHLDR